MGVPQRARTAAHGKHCAGAYPAPLSLAQRYLEDVSFEGRNGEPTNVSEALRASCTDGIVMHRGQVVCEWSAHGLAPDTPHLIFSVSKSIAGTLGGILASCGKLDPDAPVTRYIPEMEGSVYAGGCTVRHLLDMSVGIRFDEDYMVRDGDVINYRRSTGWEPPDSPIEHTANMIQLDITALTELTYLFGCDMAERRSGHILLTASLLASKPFPAMRPVRRPRLMYWPLARLCMTNSARMEWS